MRWMVLVPGLLASACAASGDTTSSIDNNAPAPSASGGHDPNAPAFTGGASDAAPSAGGKTILYAHTDTTLFQLDPDNLTAPMVTIGDFDCVTGASGSSMTDVAVAKDGKLFGVSEVAAYPLIVQGKTVHCDATWALPSNAKFYGLTMAPENTVAATEVLIGANGAGELFQIDATTGHTTQVGTLGLDAQGNPYELSGDIVFLANGGSPIGFATVRTCVPGKHGKAPTCSSSDTLIEVDVKAIHAGTQSVLKSTRGQVKKGAWCTNPASPVEFGSMFGIAAFKDKVYGFSRKGDFIEVHNDDGSGCLISASPQNKFAGAGVTTSAPVVAPTPR